MERPITAYWQRVGHLVNSREASTTPIPESTPSSWRQRVDGEMTKFEEKQTRARDLSPGRGNEDEERENTSAPYNPREYHAEVTAAALTRDSSGTSALAANLDSVSEDDDLPLLVASDSESEDEWSAPLHGQPSTTSEMSEQEANKLAETVVWERRDGQPPPRLAASDYEQNHQGVKPAAQSQQVVVSPRGGIHTIPPRCEKLIPVVLQGAGGPASTAATGTYYVASLTLGHHTWRTTPGVVEVTPEGTACYLLVANLSARPQYLYPGTTIGHHECLLEPPVPVANPSETVMIQTNAFALDPSKAAGLADLEEESTCRCLYQ